MIDIQKQEQVQNSKMRKKKSRDVETAWDSETEEDKLKIDVNESGKYGESESWELQP